MNHIAINTGVPFASIAETVFTRSESTVAVGLHPVTAEAVSVDLADAGHLLVSARVPQGGTTTVLRSLAVQLLMNGVQVGVFDPRGDLDVLRRLGVAGGDGPTFRQQLGNLHGIAAARRGDGPAAALPSMRRAMLIDTDVTELTGRLDAQGAAWLQDILEHGGAVGVHVIAVVPYTRLDNASSFSTTVICNPPNALGAHTGLLVERSRVSTQLVNLPAATEIDIVRYGHRRRSSGPGPARPLIGEEETS